MKKITIIIAFLFFSSPVLAQDFSFVAKPYIDKKQTPYDIKWRKFHKIESAKCGKRKDLFECMDNLFEQRAKFFQDRGEPTYCERNFLKLSTEELEKEYFIREDAQKNARTRFIGEEKRKLGEIFEEELDFEKRCLGTLFNMKMKESKK